MERAKVTKEELTEQDTRFLAVYVESKNSCMVMLSEREDKLGTLAIAVPKSPTGTVTSSVLLGDRNVISARMFAEHVAAKKGKIGIVSIYLEKATEMQAQEYFSRLLEKVLKVEAQKESAAT